MDNKVIESKIRITREDRDKKYIKEELMRYHYYQEQLQKINDDIRRFKVRYNDLINDPPIGGSIIKLPDGTPDSSNLVIRLQGRLNSMQEDKHTIEKQIARVDSWLAALTHAQYEAVLLYVCEYQCQDRRHAALELQSEDSGLKKRVKRAIDRIYTKFYKNVPPGTQLDMI